MNGRLERLREELDPLAAASFLVSDPVNVRYLTGFDSSNAYVLVDREQVLVFTDGRYITAARALPGVEAVAVDRELAASLGPLLPDVARQPVAFEADDLTVAEHAQVAAGGVELVATNGVVKGLRAVKEPQELDAIRRAARIANDVYDRLAGAGLTGRSEADVAWWIEQALRDEGADDVSFEPVVASGPNAARPHHHPGERRIERGDVVLVDAGARVDGYCSDCTRTFATGPLPDDLARAYAVCRTAQETALASVRAGAEARALDALARAEIAEAGIEVLHGLGHGVGLEVHELPVLRPTADGALRAGNVVTIEPGVYLAGRGGVRIEDLVVVSDGRAEILTPFTKDLLVLD